MSMKLNIAGAVLLPITLASIALLTANAQDSDLGQLDLTEKEQAKLDKELEGRVAGPAKSCIQLRDQEVYRAISDEILIFSATRNSKTIYVNMPHNGCPGAKRDALQYKRPDTALCHGNSATVFDFRANVLVSSCAFGKFVPYTKTDN